MATNPAVTDLADLQRRAADLAARAEAETRAYQRSTWIRFTAVFFPVPLIVVLLRLEIDAWTYYVWGALIVGSAALLYRIDGAASDRADAAVKAAERARVAYEEARKASDPLTPP